MDDPIQEITPIIHTLTQGSPKEQAEAINTYFTRDASFTHPFCRTSSFEGSRWFIHNIFRWYKILSPTIELQVSSVALDETSLILYATISQTFAIWFIPFHRSPVTLTTKLNLTRQPSPPSSNSSSRWKYYITSQNDLYQVDQFVKFFAPWGIGTFFVLLWHFWATLCCVVLAHVGKPFTRYMQRRADGRIQSQSEKNGESERASAKESIESVTNGVNGTNGVKLSVVQGRKSD